MYYFIVLSIGNLKVSKTIDVSLSLQSETAASSSACSFDLGRAPVLRPEDELSYLRAELFPS